MNRTAGRLLSQIGDEIEGLKLLMGIKVCPPNQKHYLYPNFLEYEAWNQTRDFTRLPKSVLILGDYAATILNFKSCWVAPKIRKHLSAKLNDAHHVKGILAESRAASHFAIFNKSVEWLPNIGSTSESDLRVMTNSGSIVNIECTRLSEKPTRADEFVILKQDTLASLRNKIIQTRTAPHPTLVSIFIPEEVVWREDDSTKSLGREIVGMLRNLNCSTICAVSVVSFEPPKLSVKPNGLYFFDNSIPAVLFTHKQASMKFPSDFISGRLSGAFKLS
jgi:hypothetical protein